MEFQLQSNLETMMGCPIDQIPEGLVGRCERVKELIKRVKPYGGLMSTQVLAGVVVGWEHTATEDEQEQLILGRDTLRAAKLREKEGLEGESDMENPE